MLAHTHKHARASVHTRCIYTQSYAYIHVHYSKYIYIYIYRIYVPIVTNYKHVSLYWWICYRVIIVHVVLPLLLLLDNRVTQTGLFPSLLSNDFNHLFLFHLWYYCKMGPATIAISQTLQIFIELYIFMCLYIYIYMYRI